MLDRHIHFFHPPEWDEEFAQLYELCKAHARKYGPPWKTYREHLTQTCHLVMLKEYALPILSNDSEINMTESEYNDICKR